MEQLENRNNIRIANQIQMLNLLRQKKMTVTDLASHTGLSFTAASNIIDEMIEEGIVRIVSKKKPVKGRGRIPVFVEMNTDEGVVCGIDFSSTNVQISIVNLNCEVLASESIPNATFITLEHLQQSEVIIKRLLQDKAVRGRKLLSICIASPGMIRPETFEYAAVYRVKNFDKINPVVFFSNAFNVKVEMYNDVRIGCLAELKVGAFPKTPFNGIFLHIGTGSGAALLFNGKIYSGTNGFAGETAAYEETDQIVKESRYNCRLFSIWEIFNEIRENKGLGKAEPNTVVDFDKIVDDYFNKKDEATIQAIEESAKRNAITLIGLCSMLDLEYAVIEGSILKLGNAYIDLLRKYMIKYSLNSVRTRIVESALGGDSPRIGACYQAVTSYLLGVLENATRKRINTPSFRLNPAFKEI